MAAPVMVLHQVQAHGDGSGRLPRPHRPIRPLTASGLPADEGEGCPPQPSRAGWRLPPAPLSTALCGGAFATPEKGRCPADRRRQGGAVLVREPGPISTLAQARRRSTCIARLRALGPTVARSASESDALPAPIGSGRHPPEYARLANDANQLHAHSDPCPGRLRFIRRPCGS